MNFYKLVTIGIVIFSSLFYKAHSQHFYLGGGYNIAYSKLSGFNTFINAYNADPTKDGGWTFDKPIENLHWLKGGCIGGGIEFEGILFDVTWSRRAAEGYANYEIPSHSERWIGYKSSTLGFGLNKRFIELGNIQVFYGLAMDFTKQKARTYTLNQNENDWRTTDSSGNFAFTPSLTFLYKPLKNIPLTFSLRPYYQMNFAKLSCANYDIEMYGNYDGDNNELKTSGGNIGIMFQLYVDVFAVKDIKLPERKPKPVKVEIQDQVIKGRITDAKSGLPVDAVITFYIDNKPASSFITLDGYYSLNSAQYVTYTIETKAFGYQTKSETLTINSSSDNPLIHNIQLSKIPMGQAMKLENILFEKASAKLLPESYPELDKLYKFMLTNQNVEIEVAGHTSSEGNDDYNMKLSQDRANAIASYLSDKGISRSRIVAKGYGETKPLASNETEEGRKLNRRVEFKITKQ